MLSFSNNVSTCTNLLTNYLHQLQRESSHFKTYLRNLTGQNRLNGLGLLNKHRVNMNVKIYGGIDKLKKASKRKMSIG